MGTDRQSGLNIIVERASRLVNISLMPNKAPQATKVVTLRCLSKHPGTLFKSIAYDNGSENVLRHEINDKLDARSNFYTPYHSWKKSTVEQINSLIRRYFPKGTDFNEVSAHDINRVEKLLNNRPKKCLNHQTPYEVFKQACGALVDCMWPSAKTGWARNLLACSRRLHSQPTVTSGYETLKLWSSLELVII